MNEKVTLKTMTEVVKQEVSIGMTYAALPKDVYENLIHLLEESQFAEDLIGNEVVYTGRKEHE